MRKVTKESPLPLYYQLKEILLEMIENEELKPGDPIPPERELCKKHGISRMTARKAVMSLANEGVVFREQGRGTFVARPKINQKISNLRGFTEEMKEKGLITKTKLLSFKIKKATKENKKHLEMLGEDDKVIEIKRLRYINEEPFCIEVASIPHELCPDMKRENLENNSLYNLLEKKYGFKLKYAKQTIEPIMSDEYESDLLNQKEKILCLLFRRKTYLEDEKIIECTKAIYRGDIYKYEIRLDR